MSTKQVDAESRTITETHETAVPNVVLVIESSHHRGQITSSARRREITNIGFREKFGIGMRDDPAPAPRTAKNYKRYSLKQLEIAHEHYVEQHASNAGQIKTLTAWAERY